MDPKVEADLFFLLRPRSILIPASVYDRSKSSLTLVRLLQSTCPNFLRTPLDYLGKHLQDSQSKMNYTLFEILLFLVVIPN